MNYKIITFLLILILFVFDLYFIIDKFKGNQNYEYYSNTSEIEILENNSILISKYSHERFIADVSCTDDSGAIYSLSELIIARDRLVLRYPSVSCQMCLDSAVKSIKSFSKKVGQEKVLILCDFTSNRDLRVFKSVNNIEDIQILNLQNKSTGLTFEQFGKPFFFILTKKFEIRNYFIFEPLLPDLTTKYFEATINCL